MTLSVYNNLTYCYLCGSSHYIGYANCPRVDSLELLPSGNLKIILKDAQEQ